MFYDKTLLLKNGEKLHLRSATKEDTQKVYNLFQLTHGQTDFLLAYPEENSFTVRQEEDFLNGLLESPREIMLLAEVNGSLAGCASVCAVGNKFKVQHRAEFGISVDKAFWNLGIGKTLTQAAIECAKTARYTYLELSVVADNARAVGLYKSLGFHEFGRHPKGFRSKSGSYQELTFMGYELLLE